MQILVQHRIGSRNFWPVRRWPRRRDRGCRWPHAWFARRLWVAFTADAVIITVVRGLARLAVYPILVVFAGAPTIVGGGTLRQQRRREKSSTKRQSCESNDSFHRFTPCWLGGCRPTGLAYGGNVWRPAADDLADIGAVAGGYIGRGSGIRLGKRGGIFSAMIAAAMRMTAMAAAGSARREVAGGWRSLGRLLFGPGRVGFAGIIADLRHYSALGQISLCFGLGAPRFRAAFPGGAVG